RRPRPSRARSPGGRGVPAGPRPDPQQGGPGRPPREPPAAPSGCAARPAGDAAGGVDLAAVGVLRRSVAQGPPPQAPSDQPAVPGRGAAAAGRRRRLPAGHRLGRLRPPHAPPARPAPRARAPASRGPGPRGRLLGPDPGEHGAHRMGTTIRGSCEDRLREEGTGRRPLNMGPRIHPGASAPGAGRRLGPRGSGGAVTASSGTVRAGPRMPDPADVELPADWEDDDQPDPGRGRGRRAALIALGLVAVLVLGVGLVIGNYLNGLKNSYEKRTVVQITRDADHGERPEEIDGTGRNFLLLGSDKRSEEDAAAQGVSGERSDVMMLVHVSDDDESVYVTSFPRDLYVDIPGHGKDRINAALAFGGPGLAVSTVEDYTGVPVDHVALIDFDGIEGLVDTLGGVDVQVPLSFEADGHQFTEGTQTLDG